MNKLVLWLDQLCMADLDQVGGKNASLGEMTGKLGKLGIAVPGGFAITAEAFRQHLEHSRMRERIAERLTELDVNDLDALGKL